SAEVNAVDRDLEGLQLVEMPWLLDDPDSRPLYAGLRRARLEPGANLSRLHALGVDAFRLAWTETLPGPWSLVRGVTGTLSTNARRQIERELQVAEFDRGGLRPR
ncbi:MAG: penicillin-binding protein activator, partial [Lamprobacter sp.]|uniref:penicillin-binding protein activator n=1 Tax=Lamprobacter sp. TaxID=3100796 RepID=UPI002B25B063